MCIAAMKTMTNAQKGKRALKAAGIPCEIVGLDATLTKNGCAYGLKYPKSKAEQAKIIMEKSRISYGEVLGE